jgi:hypothetical protein
MRNGFLGSLVALLAAAAPLLAQAPPREAPSFVPGLDALWQPPRTDLDDRPNIDPGGYRFYGRLDYLLWWTQKDRPLPAVALDPKVHPGSVFLPEATDFGPLLRQGNRGVIGWWLDPQQRYGLEIGGFWVADRNPMWSGGAPSLGSRSDFVSRLSGGEAAFRGEVYRGDWAHVDLLAGFRYLNFDETLRIGEHDAAADVVTSDRFGTHNHFYGGQLGAEVELHHQQWLLDLWGKAALGANVETVNVLGTTLAGGQAAPGGLLASPAANGRHRRDQFAVVPELGVNVGYELLQHIRITVGYTILYVSDAARPGAQTGALLRLPHSSAFPFAASDFWVQGLNFGFEFRF